MKTTEERFWEKVNKTDSCWLWIAAVTHDGYGRFKLNKTHVLSHRFAYEQIKGTIPKGMQLDHLCKIKHCLNPEHLEPVTPQENSKRGNSGINMKVDNYVSPWKKFQK
jgi:HNH endonuclease